MMQLTQHTPSLALAYTGFLRFSQSKTQLRPPLLPLSHSPHRAVSNAAYNYQNKFKGVQYAARRYAPSATQTGPPRAASATVSHVRYSVQPRNPRQLFQPSVHRRQRRHVAGIAEEGFKIVRADAKNVEASCVPAATPKEPCFAEHVKS